MHEFDILGVDHVSQALDVAPDHKGVFGRERQSDVFRTTPLQFHHLTSAFRGNDRFLSSEHQRLGHIYGAALYTTAPNIKGRQNLEHDWQAGRRVTTSPPVRSCGSGYGARVESLVHPSCVSVPRFMAMVSTDSALEYIKAEDGTRLAFVATAATHPDPGPGIVFLGGFMSDMTGQKATVLEAWARETGRAFLRLDYGGHGKSGGEFHDGTIGGWCSHALTVIRHAGKTVTGLDESLVLVGSSMGGWMAALIARNLSQSGGKQRATGLVTIAAAPDFTEDLMPARLGPEVMAQIAETGIYEAPSAYSERPYVITRALLEDGRENLVLTKPLDLDIPARLIHGTADPDVPWTQSEKLMHALNSSDVELILVKDGDHRLSTPADLARLTHIVGTLCDQLSASRAASPAR